MAVTLLHTSDWHLGRRLYGKSRDTEFHKFLTWLLEILIKKRVDILLIAGDIFDTNTPSHQAQSLYYDFLTQVAKTHCRHVVIVAGNHDSPSFLEAPKGLLKALDIHVIGSVSENLADEVLVLYNAQHIPEMIIMAVPYLRDRDVRQVQAGEQIEDKEKKLISGIANHYQQVSKIAIQKQHELQQQYQISLPIVATGHLFTHGGKTIDGDGVRDLYVGTLAYVTADIFDKNIDYVALGHLHVPQMVANQAHIRYSGSPIAMGFAEANQKKQINLIKFYTAVSTLPYQKPNENTTNYQLNLLNNLDDDNMDYLCKFSKKIDIEFIHVPVFQALQTIKGDWPLIKNSLIALKQQNISVWLEIVYNGDDVIGDLKQQIYDIVKNSQLIVLKIKNLQIRQQLLMSQNSGETLEELDEKQVFERCLQANKIPKAQQSILWQNYSEILDLIRS